MFIEEKLNQQSEEVKRAPTLRSAVTPPNGEIQTSRESWVERAALPRFDFWR
jgi:hypothetical protein